MYDVNDLIELGCTRDRPSARRAARESQVRSGVQNVGPRPLPASLQQTATLVFSFTALQ